MITNLSNLASHSGHPLFSGDRTPLGLGNAEHFTVLSTHCGIKTDPHDPSDFGSRQVNRGSKIALSDTSQLLENEL